MTQLSKLEQLLKQVKVCEGQSCRNCKHSAWEGGDSSVGIDAYLYCGHPENDEGDEDSFYGTLVDYAEMVQQPKEPIEDAIGRNCPNYEAKMATECEECKSALNIPEHLAIKANAIYNAAAVCSEECKTKFEAKAQQEHEADLKAAREFQLGYEDLAVS